MHFKSSLFLWCKAEFSATITPVFSITWSLEIIIICWFSAQETFHIIINIEISCAASLAADLTVVQKTIIDTLHKEGKLQTFIAKEAGCSQSAVSKHVYRNLSGRKKCGKKNAQPTERTTALWGLSSKIDSRIRVNFTRNGLRLGSRHQEPPHTDVSRNLAIFVVREVLPVLRRRITIHLSIQNVHCTLYTGTKALLKWLCCLEVVFSIGQSFLRSGTKQGAKLKTIQPCTQTNETTFMYLIFYY